MPESLPFTEPERAQLTQYEYATENITVEPGWDIYSSTMERLQAAGWECQHMATFLPDDYGKMAVKLFMRRETA